MGSVGWPGEPGQDRSPQVVAGVVAVMVIGALIGGAVDRLGGADRQRVEWTPSSERLLVALSAPWPGLEGSALADVHHRRRWERCSPEGAGLALGLGAVAASDGVLLTIDRRNWVVGAAGWGGGDA
jgi:hypothetical protein